jgi:TolB-like protein
MFIEFSKGLCMKKDYMVGFLFVSMAFALYAGGKQEQPQTPDPAVQVPTPAVRSAPAPVAPASPFYTGTGGKGISLAILAPRATGLEENQGYIPALVQGEFVSNLSGYSALSVMDRQNLDNVYAELLSGYYDDDAEAGLDLGHLMATDYLMTGSITRTATGYALQMQIIKTADKMTVASYSGTCTFAELDNLTGIRKASLELLEKVGVTVTERARTELAGAAAKNHINAQTALAQGITAQQGGTVVEALSYYYQATAFDSSLLEAASRAGVMSAAISSGNIGENVRNDIQRRREWEKALNEAEEYFSKHLLYEIVYVPTLTQGKVDYAKETVDMSFPIKVQPTESFSVLQDLVNGLQKSGKAEEWGFNLWPFSIQEAGSRWGRRTKFITRPLANGGGGAPSVAEGMYTLTVMADLENEQGITVSTCSMDMSIGLGFPYQISSQVITEYKLYTSFPINSDFDASFMVDNAGYDETNHKQKYTQPRPKNGTVNMVFKDVNANDITDSMAIKIVTVNGIDAETIGKTGYIRISAGGMR